jgi:putative phosphoribosyl transferase
VASPDASRRFKDAADRFISAVTMPFLSVGEAYEDFSQVSDGDVVNLIPEAATA